MMLVRIDMKLRRRKKAKMEADRVESTIISRIDMPGEMTLSLNPC